jgi:hypothetical protein
MRGRRQRSDVEMQSRCHSGMVRKDQTTDAQLRIGESRDSGLTASRRPGMTADLIQVSNSPPSLRAKRSNPFDACGAMDCFVAEPVIGPRIRADPLAPRNDEVKARFAFPQSVQGSEQSPCRKSLQGGAIHLDPESRAIGHAHHALHVLDGLRQQRLADRMFGAIELEHGLDRLERGGGVRR